MDFRGINLPPEYLHAAAKNPASLQKRGFHIRSMPPPAGEGILFLGNGQAVRHGLFMVPPRAAVKLIFQGPEKGADGKCLSRERDPFVFRCNNRSSQDFFYWQYLLAMPDGENGYLFLFDAIYDAVMAVKQLSELGIFNFWDNPAGFRRKFQLRDFREYGVDPLVRRRWFVPGDVFSYFRGPINR